MKASSLNFLLVLEFKPLMRELQLETMLLLTLATLKKGLINEDNCIYYYLLDLLNFDEFSLIFPLFPRNGKFSLKVETLPLISHSWKFYRRPDFHRLLYLYSQDFYSIGHVSDAIWYRPSCWEVRFSHLLQLALWIFATLNFLQD